MSDDLYDGPCEAGCESFHGGERKHHPDCGHYPQSLTKLHADRIEELEAKLATCRKYRDAYAECDRISTHALRKAVEALDEAVYLLAPDEEDMAKKAGVYRVVTTLAELKGETDE